MALPGVQERPSIPPLVQEAGRRPRLAGASKYLWLLGQASGLLAEPVSP